MYLYINNFIPSLNKLNVVWKVIFEFSSLNLDNSFDVWRVCQKNVCKMSAPIFLMNEAGLGLFKVTPWLWLTPNDFL